MLQAALRCQTKWRRRRKNPDIHLAGTLLISYQTNLDAAAIAESIVFRVETLALI